MKTSEQSTFAPLALAISLGSASEQVHNGDFLNAIKAPSHVQRINLANGWSKANGRTADFYHSNAKKCSDMGTAKHRI